MDVLHELDDQRFELTSLGECLRSDVPDSIVGWAAFIGRPYYWQAWTGLLHSVYIGENAFQHVHGTDVWAYCSVRLEESEIFDRKVKKLVLGRREPHLQGLGQGAYVQGSIDR